MSPRKILVVGATGKQGSAFVRAAATSLSSDDSTPASDFHLLALTRNASSEAAQKLASLGDRVTVVTADLDSVESVRKIFEGERTKPEGGIWGVFVALAFPGLGVDASGEEAQCKVRPIHDYMHVRLLKRLLCSWLRTSRPSTTSSTSSTPRPSAETTAVTTMRS